METTSCANAYEHKRKNVRKYTYELLEKLEKECINELSGIISTYINTCDVKTICEYDLAVDIYGKVELLVPHTRKKIDFFKELDKYNNIQLGAYTINNYAQSYISVHDPDQAVLDQVISSLLQENRGVIAASYVRYSPIIGNIHTYMDNISKKYVDNKISLEEFKTIIDTLNASIPIVD